MYKSILGTKDVDIREHDRLVLYTIGRFYFPIVYDVTLHTKFMQ